MDPAASIAASPPLTWRSCHLALKCVADRSSTTTDAGCVGRGTGSVCSRSNRHHTFVSPRLAFVFSLLASLIVASDHHASPRRVSANPPRMASDNSQDRYLPSFNLLDHMAEFRPTTLTNFYLGAGDQEHYFYDADQPGVPLRGAFLSPDGAKFHVLDPNGELVPDRGYYNNTHTQVSKTLGMEVRPGRREGRIYWNKCDMREMSYRRIEKAKQLSGQDLSDRAVRDGDDVCQRAASCGRSAV